MSKIHQNRADGSRYIALPEGGRVLYLTKDVERGLVS